MTVVDHATSYRLAFPHLPLCEVYVLAVKPSGTLLSEYYKQLSTELNKMDSITINVTKERPDVMTEMDNLQRPLKELGDNICHAYDQRTEQVVAVNEETKKLNRTQLFIDLRKLANNLPSMDDNEIRRHLKQLRRY